MARRRARAWSCAMDDDLFGPRPARRGAPPMGRRRGGGSDAPPPASIADDFDDSSDDEPPAPRSDGFGTNDATGRGGWSSDAPTTVPAPTSTASGGWAAPAPSRGGADGERAGGIAADFDDDDAPLPPSRAVASRRDTPGGWSADDAPAAVPVAPSAPRERNSAPRGRPRDVPPSPDGDLAVPRNRHDEIERDVGDLAEIPDLDDAGDAWDAPDELAAVPAYDAGTRVQTIGELDEAKGGFASRARPGYVETEDDAGDIDLSLLTSALIPAELVREDDEEWIPEKLWEQLKAELRAEEEAREEAAAERRAAAPEAPPPPLWNAGGDGVAAEDFASTGPGDSPGGDVASAGKKKKKGILGRIGSKLKRTAGREF